MSNNEFYEKAFAKINLFLHVLGKNDKGYHLLDSLFVFADIGDDIVLSRSDSEKITVTTAGEFGNDIPTDDSNLVVKAAHAFGAFKGLNIKLTKNVPVSSGIGGGSADAAAVIRGLIKMNSLQLSSDEITRKATSIGADVPACVYSQSCRIGGIGEQIKLFTVNEKFKVLLINPLRKIMTKDIFGIGVKKFSLQADIDKNNLVSSLKNARNDLIEPASQLVPEIKDIITNLNKTKGCILAGMSGSGATCFALYGNDDDLKTAETTLHRQYADYWIKTGNIL